jgi:hypothetical protein
MWAKYFLKKLNMFADVEKKCQFFFGVVLLKLHGLFLITVNTFSYLPEIRFRCKIKISRTNCFPYKNTVQHNSCETSTLLKALWELFSWEILRIQLIHFYLPHMEYEGSIGFVMRKMKNFYCWFSRFRTFYG